MTTDIAYAAIPLPDDVARMKQAGFFEDCAAAIRTYLEGDLPQALRCRLELELERLPFLPESEYPYTDDQAVALLTDTFLDFRPGELEELVAARSADWLYIRGVRHFHRRFIANILTTRPDYVARQRHPDPETEEDVTRKERLMENIALMKEKGSRRCRITIKAEFRLKPEAVREGVPLTVHMPVPKPCGHQSDIRILALSHPAIAQIAPESARQRTVCFPGAPAGDTFAVTYSYVNSLNYVNPDPSLSRPGLPGGMEEFLGEEAPHVLFTPYMRALLKEVRGGEENPIRVARAIYDFVTTKVKYSYMKEYAYLDTICEYAARNLKGDCGVQAILFITLCRLAGIPARWQSGLAADPGHVGCHDWAEFYVNPYGWLHADCSYGGSAYREGNLEKWNYYFGNLDVFRMVANDQMQSQFTHEKVYFRADPTDNQRGEAEYPDGGVLPFHFEHRETMLEFEELE